MYATVRIRADIPADWVVPVAAVTTGENAHCFLVQNGKAEKTPVQLGRSDGQHIELLKLRRDDLWSDVTSADRLAMPVAGLVNGQELAHK
jgi:hypothetical protein